jgi:hypothetical protein
MDYSKIKTYNTTPVKTVPQSHLIVETIILITGALAIATLYIIVAL